MRNQVDFFSLSLIRSQFDRLSECATKSQQTSPQILLIAAKQHLELAGKAHFENQLVNIRLASAIVKVLEELVENWSSMDLNQAWWLKGAMHYFATSNDDEPDFESPLGFEDDAEILNACLKFIGRKDLCLMPEDYDHA